MLNLGTGELVVLFLAALVVLGPNKLPDAARQMGRVAAELRRLSSGFQDEIRAAMVDPTPPPPPPPAPTPPLPETSPGPGGPTATEEVAPEVPSTRRRREPLRADGAVSAEQQL